LQLTLTQKLEIAEITDRQEVPKFLSGRGVALQHSQPTSIKGFAKYGEKKTANATYPWEAL
jgi:hypothetical protein